MGTEITPRFSSIRPGLSRRFRRAPAPRPGCPAGGSRPPMPTTAWSTPPRERDRLQPFRAFYEKVADEPLTHLREKVADELLTHLREKVADELLTHLREKVADELLTHLREKVATT